MVTKAGKPPRIFSGVAPCYAPFAARPADISAGRRKEAVAFTPVRKKSQRKVHVVRLTLTMFVGEAGEVLFPLQLALAADESG